MSRYEPLKRFLGDSVGNNISLSFDKIERIIGNKLPDSAYKHRPWWANGGHSQANSWLDAGWKVDDVNFQSEFVVFIRVGSPKIANTKKNIDNSIDQNKIHGHQISGQQFESIVKEVLEKEFNTRFIEREIPGVHKKFDFVSQDGSIVGDAKYYTMVRGISDPSAKFSIIAEYVWLLEKISAKNKFLVFGNDKRVPLKWLSKFGNLVNNVDFYFYDHEQNEFEKLN